MSEPTPPPSLPIGLTPNALPAGWQPGDPRPGWRGPFLANSAPDGTVLAIQYSRGYYGSPEGLGLYNDFFKYDGTVSRSKAVYDEKNGWWDRFEVIRDQRGLSREEELPEVPDASRHLHDHELPTFARGLLRLGRLVDTA